MNDKMPAPDATFVRLECLRLTIQRHGPLAESKNSEAILEEAGRMADFCIGSGPSGPSGVVAGIDRPRFSLGQVKP